MWYYVICNKKKKINGMNLKIQERKYYVYNAPFLSYLRKDKNQHCPLSFQDINSH